jgi:hypothetical protein
MAHYAFIDEQNVVVEVIVGREEGEGGIDWEQHYGEVRGLRCLRTSYNTLHGVHLTGGVPFRGTYAGVGMIFDEAADVFRAAE